MKILSNSATVGTSNTEVIGTVKSGVEKSGGHFEVSKAA